MASSDERREVARKLRDCIFHAKGHDLDGDCDMWSDKCVETRCTLYNDIAACIEEGGNVNLSSEEVFDRLADLIDPTCEAAHDNPFASDFNYRCMACGEHFSTCGEPKYCPGCGGRIEHVK